MLKMWKLFRETNSLEFWNVQNVRMENYRPGHSSLLVLVFFSSPNSAFCCPQKQGEILHGFSGSSPCQGLVWQDPVPYQGPVIWIICSAHARLLMLCSCLGATSDTPETVLVHLVSSSSFSSRGGTFPRMECCVTLACVQRVVRK